MYWINSRDRSLHNLNYKITLSQAENGKVLWILNQPIGSKLHMNGFWNFVTPTMPYDFYGSSQVHQVPDAYVNRIYILASFVGCPVNPATLSFQIDKAAMGERLSPKIAYHIFLLKPIYVEHIFRDANGGYIS